MKPQAAFAALLSSLTAPLKDRGFIRKGASYYVRRGGNVGVINLQKSAKTTKDRVLFAINVGVASERLQRVFGEHRSAMPTIDACHWSRRLQSEGGGEWWTLETDPGSVSSAVIRVVLNHGVSAIERCLDDTNLRDLWLSGQSDGLTAVQRLMYLVVLLSEIGPSERVGPTAEELRRHVVGKPSAGKAMWVLRRVLGETAIQRGLDG